MERDLGNTFQFEREFNEIYCGTRNVEVARGLNPELQTFDEWLAQNTSRIPWDSRRALLRDGRWCASREALWEGATAKKEMTEKPKQGATANADIVAHL